MLTSLFKYTENSPPELLKPRTHATRGKQFAQPLTRIGFSSKKTDKTGKPGKTGELVKHLTFAGLIKTKTSRHPINSESVKPASTVKPQNRKSEITSTHIKKAVKNADTHLAMIFLKPELPSGCVLNGDAADKPLAIDPDNSREIKQVPNCHSGLDPESSVMLILWIPASAGMTNSNMDRGKPAFTSVIGQSFTSPKLNKTVTKNVADSQPTKSSEPEDEDRGIPVHKRQNTEKTKREFLHQERGSLSRTPVGKTISSDAGKSSPQSNRTSHSTSPVITVDNTPVKRHDGRVRVPVNPQVQQVKTPAISYLNPTSVFMKSYPSVRVGVSATPMTLTYEGETTSAVVETPGRTDEQPLVSPKQSGTSQPPSKPADERMSGETPLTPVKQDTQQSETPARALRAEVQPSITLELFARSFKAPIVVDNKRPRVVGEEHPRSPSEPAAPPAKSDSPSNVKPDHQNSKSHQEPDTRLPDRSLKSVTVENANTQQSGGSVETTKPVSPSAKQTGFISYARTTPQTTPSVDRGELVNSIKMTLTNGRGEMVLQLKPEVLGRALIILRQGENGLKLEFEVEHPEAKQIIEAETPQLREALNAAGIQTVSIEVRTSDPHQGRFAQTNNGSQRNGQHNGRDGEEPGSHQRQEHTSRPRFLGYNSFDIAA